MYGFDHYNKKIFSRCHYWYEVNIIRKHKKKEKQQKQYQWFSISVTQDDNLVNEYNYRVILTHIHANGPRPHIHSLKINCARIVDHR